MILICYFEEELQYNNIFDISIIFYKGFTFKTHVEEPL
jgi:hypothetical protein